MKATRANLLGEFTGKLDGLIYYRNPRSGKLYVRRRWKVKPTAQTAVFTSSVRAVYALNPSPAYIRDLKDYMLQYNLLSEIRPKPAWAWTNIYMRLMYAMQKAMPESVDLCTLTRQQIYAQNLPCRSVKAAVEAGLLPVVKGYERFMAEI